MTGAMLIVTLTHLLGARARVDVVAHEGIGNPVTQQVIRVAERITLTQPGFSWGSRIGATAEAIDGSAVGFSRRMAVSSRASAKKA